MNRRQQRGRLRHYMVPPRRKSWWERGLDFLGRHTFAIFVAGLICVGLATAVAGWNLTTGENCATTWRSDGTVERTCWDGPVPPWDTENRRGR